MLFLDLSRLAKGFRQRKVAIVIRGQLGGRFGLLLGRGSDIDFCILVVKRKRDREKREKNYYSLLEK